MPTPAGGNNDFAARVIGPKLAEILGQQVVFDNRVGEGSNIGAEMVARAAPDDYTLLMAMSAQTINMSLYRRASHRVQRPYAGRIVRPRDEQHKSGQVLFERRDEVIKGEYDAAGVPRFQVVAIRKLEIGAVVIRDHRHLRPHDISGANRLPARL